MKEALRVKNFINNEELKEAVAAYFKDKGKILFDFSINKKIDKSEKWIHLAGAGKFIIFFIEIPYHHKNATSYTTRIQMQISFCTPLCPDIGEGVYVCLVGPTIKSFSKI